MLRVLEEVAGNEPRKLADIATAAGVTKPSVHRILAELTELGYAVADGAGSYSAGPRLRALAAEVADGTAAASIDQLLTALQRQVGQTVHLALRNGDHAVYTQKVESDQPYQMASRVGMRLPLHCTAIGKSVLAHLPADELAAVLASTGLPGRTPATITTPEHLARELAAVRERGYAIDDEENETTIRCIGVPVLDASGTAIGGISVSTVKFLVTAEQLAGFAPALRATADQIALLLR
ncbi:IclR family transcriptional regulator [Goodfellowiella coeruleoviolacea]|nr:IclR family transcriptional regulator [Goodfellowiella coeruleoviolacea]